jgi:transposase
MNVILYCCAPGAPGAICHATAFPRSTVYNIFRKFQRDGVWERSWPSRTWPCGSRLAGPSTAALDCQSVKSAEKGAAQTTKWIKTPASRSRSVKSTRWLTAKDRRCVSSSIPPRSRIATGPGWPSTRYAGGSPARLIRADGGYNPRQVDAALARCRSCPWRSSSGASTRRASWSCRAAGDRAHPLLVRVKPRLARDFENLAEALTTSPPSSSPSGSLPGR